MAPLHDRALSPKEIVRPNKPDYGGVLFRLCVTSAVLCALCGYCFSRFFYPRGTEVRREYRQLDTTRITQREIIA